MSEKVSSARGPLVSVVMPVYNRARYVAETIESLRAQTYANLEIICVDDCSTDDSLAVLHGLAVRDRRIRVIASAVNGGPGAARNIGIAAAEGKYISFSDSDDLAIADKIAVETEYLEQHPDVGIVGAYSESFGESSGINPKPCRHAEIFAALMLFRCPYHMSTVMVRRQVLNDHNIRFDESIRIGEDTVFYAEVACVARAANLPVVLSRTRIHGDSLLGSVSKDHKFQQELLDNIFRLMKGVFNLSDAEAAQVSFFYGQEPVDSENIKGFGLLVQKFLEHTAPKDRQVVKQRLFKRFYGLYKNNPQLTQKNRKVFFKNAVKYKTAVFLALKMCLKNKL